MLITFFRSSSLNRWASFCEHAYFLERVIGEPTIANIKADKGSICHKALETLARKKLAEQGGLATFIDDDTKKEFTAADLTVDRAVDFAWWVYTEHRPTPHVWTQRDYMDCRQWTYDILNYNNGQLSPLKRTVVSPEQYFDFTVEEPWARYSYLLPDGGKLEGHLAVKGTVDLLLDAGPDTLEYCDWKTGKRMEWATRTYKTYEDLREDPQLLLYHYAIRRLYPGRRQVIMTIFFVNDGGPESLCFDDRDVKKAEEMLRKHFEAIRNTVRPKLNKSWKTCGLCHFAKNNFPGTDKTVCDHYRDELLSLGMDRVVKKYAKLDQINSYGEGGGRRV